MGGCSQDETSEMFIGEWMEARGVRDQMVVATKVRMSPRPGTRFSWAPEQFTTQYKRADDAVKQKVQFAGNSAKALRNSVAASLAKLRTGYIDILYVHWWDYTAGVEEVMGALHHLVVAGKVLYLVCPL